VLRQEVWNDFAMSSTLLIGDIGGRSYVINSMGGIEAQLPRAALVKAAHTAVTFDDVAALSRGTLPVPDACKLDQAATRWYEIYLVVTCVKEYRPSLVEGSP
jgi:hypothetical protein